MVLDSILRELNRRIEQAALHSEVTEEGIERLCAEAIEYDLYAVVVNPAWVANASKRLMDSRVRLVSVVGFPLGANRTDIKVAEAVEAVLDGAHEIDMVANIGWLVANRFAEVEAEIRKVRRQIPADIVLKVIIEAGKLSDQQQSEATKAVVLGGAQFVKTSTGFFGGATVDQVNRLVASSAGQIEVKASGGIKTVADCEKLLAAGATRLGTSSGPAILRELKQLSQ
ncbi:MAG: deoxyribose-phosphate aldolase [bacterium]|nr:deoxyribose-phosphate aldolase [bacterium]